eukprot:gene14748-19824_t
MSLFESLGQGDIWELSGITFSSPVNDLIDRGIFTLEELLEEDELIQEVKAKNDRLTEFLTQESVLDHLLDFIVHPAAEDDDDKKRFKYPYMSCEVICCEVPAILNAITEEYDGRYLDKLFSLLTVNPKLDNYLAGYFEKILEMLFRNMTVSMMRYFNTSGISLLEKFVAHIDNYSIMQIVQRLMLPHIPFTNSTEMENISYEEIKEVYQCNWSYMVASCTLLFDKMFNTNNPDVPLHILDLLITVIQLSPPETLVVKVLCQPECVDTLLQYAVAEDADVYGVGDKFSTIASASLASISVFESLISRLFEASITYDQNMNRELENDYVMHIKDNLDSICHQIVPYIPKIEKIMKNYMEKNPCEQLLNQCGRYVPRLGHRGLQLIKLIESINRLGNPMIDASFCESTILKTCLDLFFYFESNSLVHLSVQRIVITVIEGDISRRDTQRCLLIGCDLLGTVMDKMNDLIIKSNSGELGGLSRHSSIMGNLLLMSQALSLVLDTEGGILRQREGEEKVTEGGWSHDSLATLASVNADNEGEKEKSAEKPAANDTNYENIPSNPIEIKSNSLRAILSKEILVEWEKFYDTKLRPILNLQVMSNYQHSAQLNNSLPQDDPMKLGIDMDIQQFSNHNNRDQFDQDDQDDEWNFFDNGGRYNNNYNTNYNEDNDEFQLQNTNGSMFTVEEDRFADFDAFGSDAFNNNNDQQTVFESFASFPTNAFESIIGNQTPTESSPFTLGQTSNETFDPFADKSDIFTFDSDP